MRALYGNNNNNIIDLGKPKSRARIFFPARLFNKTKTPTMDKVRGNITARAFLSKFCNLL